ncbi:MAG: rhodanese-like domain-containing protein [Candidatus Paceibacterota bacterium]
MNKYVILVIVIVFLYCNSTSEKFPKNTFDMVIDVRTKKEWNEGHFKGAINIPHDYITSNLKRATVGIDKNAKILVYCNTGNRASLVATLLKKSGFRNIQIWNQSYQKLNTNILIRKT